MKNKFVPFFLKKNKKFIKYLINLIFIWTFISVILLLNIDFEVDIAGYVTGFSVGSVLLIFLLYELKAFKEKSSTGLVVQWRFSKFVVVCMYFFGFFCTGIYGFVYPLHSLIEEKKIQIHNIRPISPRRIRFFYCNTRVMIISSENPQKRKVYCAKKDEFTLLNSVSLSKPYKQMSVIYENSVFGQKIIALQNVNL